MNKPILIIAEAGVNHNGDPAMLKDLIKVAADAGADYIKLQTFRTEALVQRGAAKADYQAEKTDPTESQYDMLKRLELSFDAFREAQQLCRAAGIGFASTAFDFESLDFLGELQLDFWKIPSGELTNYPYLLRVAAMGLPVLLSTGMATMEEIGQALGVLKSGGLSRDMITVLHCHTAYPTAFEDVHLRAMATIGKHFGAKVGYSDHTSGISVPLAAVALGAVCIEKHFTLDRTLPGPDHAASLEPHELTAMVTGIRELERALGSTQKVPTPRESANRTPARKGLYWALDLPAGTVLHPDHLVVQRPESVTSPMAWPELVGKALVSSVKAGSPVRKTEVCP